MKINSQYLTLRPETVWRKGKTAHWLKNDTFYATRIWLPHKFRGEALMTATYLQNHLPTKIIYKTTYELWNNCKPKLFHIKVSGCKAFVYVNRHKRSKLDNKAVEGIFIGYDNRSKGYRIYTEDNNVMIVCTAKFIEHPHTNVKEEENLFDYQKQKSNNFVDSDELVRRSKPDHVAESDEVDTSEEEEDDASPPPRRSGRSTKGIPPQRFSYLTSQNRIIEPKDWKDVEEMTNSVKRKKMDKSC